MLDLEQLIAEAKSAPHPGRKQRNFDRWIKPAIEMRRRGFMYRQIYDFLQQRGEDVHPDFNTWISGMSRNLRPYFRGKVSHKM